MRFLFHQGEDLFRVSAYDPSGMLHPHFAERLRESLQFITALPLSSVATIEVTGVNRHVYIRGQASRPLQPHIHAPIPKNVARAGRSQPLGSSSPPTLLMSAKTQQPRCTVFLLNGTRYSGPVWPL